MPRQSTRILVTGATGYIGNRLAHKLASQDVEVLAQGRRQEAHLPANVKYFRLPEYPGASDWRPLLERTDVVIHCAARAHVMRETESDPLAAFRRANTTLTLELAVAALAAGVRRFVFVSSIGVCGAETLGVPFDRNSAPNPHSQYAVSKYEAEVGLRTLSANTRLEIVIVRPPLVYGPNAVGNFARLLRLVDAGLPLPFGSLHNRRSLIGLDNLVDFLALCAHHSRAGEFVHTISDGPALSTADLVRALAVALNRPPRLVPFPVSLLGILLQATARRGIAQQLLGSLEIDSSASCRLLSWSPPSSLAKEMSRVAQACRSTRIRRRLA
jgi:nucleoside-diphosphate-sugar epimerase